MRNQWVLQSIVTFGVIVCLTAQAWATQGTFRYDGKTFKCADSGPFREYIKTLQDERVHLKDEIDALDNQRLEQIQRAYKARAAYDEAVRKGDRAGQAQAETVLQNAMKERQKIEAEKATKEPQLKAIQKKVSEALGDFNRTCEPKPAGERCGPNPPGDRVIGQCR